LFVIEILINKIPRLTNHFSCPWSRTSLDTQIWAFLLAAIQCTSTLLSCICKHRP